MINTPEFWVGVSFCVCIVISFKLIIPKLKAGLDSQQLEIEKSFSDAENILKAAEKKFSIIQEKLNALPQLMVDMEAEFDTRINHQVHEWNVQKEKITTQFTALQEYKLQHLTDHIKSQTHMTIITAILNVLETYFSQHISAQKHQQIVKDAIKHLSKV